MTCKLTMRIKVNGQSVTVADEMECDTIPDAATVVGAQIHACKQLDIDPPIWSIVSDNAEGAGETLDWDD